MQQSCCALVSCGDRIDASRRAHGRLRKEARQHSALLISPRARFELATSYRYAGGDPALIQETAMASQVKRTHQAPYKLAIGGEGKYLSRCRQSKKQPACDISPKLTQ